MNGRGEEGTAQRGAPGWASWPLWEARRRRPRPRGSTLLMTWNVAGLRGLLRRDPMAIAQLVAAHRPDVLCLQETKLQEQHVEEVAAALGLAGWSASWSCSTTRLGYAGVVTLSRHPPRAAAAGLPALGLLASGRLVTSRHQDFTLINTYSPNAGVDLKNIDLRVGQYDPALGRHAGAQGSRFILAGDLNVAPQPPDVYDPQRLARLDAPGFSRAERDSFARCFLQRGLVDAFRLCHPEVRAYTFYSYRAQMRAKKRGWRLDHFLVSAAMVPAVHDCFVLDQVQGSDHLPVGLVLRQQRPGPAAE